MIAVIDREEDTRYLKSGAKYIPSIFTKLSQLRRALPSSNTKPERDADDDDDDDAQAVVCSSTAVVVVIVVELFGSCGQLILPEAL
jgi:hypothetical protein